MQLQPDIKICGHCRLVSLLDQVANPLKNNTIYIIIKVLPLTTRLPGQNCKAVSGAPTIKSDLQAGGQRAVVIMSGRDDPDIPEISYVQGRCREDGGLHIQPTNGTMASTLLNRHGKKDQGPLEPGPRGAPSSR